MRLKHVVPLVAWGIGLCGCGGNDRDILGKWKLNITVPIPATTSTAITFSADHIFRGVIVGNWTKSKDIVTMTISSYVGLPINAIRGIASTKASGASQGKNLQSISLKMDSGAKNMYLVDRKGKASTTALLTRL